MWRNFLLILISIFCLSWAEVKVEKVLETTSIKEYNQWVKKNKAKYPGLKPYYLKTECIKRGKEWKIIYYDEDGNLWKEELLKAKPGWWLYVRAYPYWGKVRLVESDSSLGESSPDSIHIKNEKGETIFSFEWGYDYPSGAGVYTLPNGIGLFRSNALENYAELLTWNGTMIGKLENLFALSMTSALEMGSVATSDGKFILLDADEFFAVLVDNGKEVWRKKFNSAIQLSISRNGEYVSIGDEGIISVYNTKVELICSHQIVNKSSSNPRAVFSSDSRFLAVAAGGQLALIDITKAQLLWKKSGHGYPLSFVNNDYIITVDKGNQKIYVYDTLGNLQATINVPYGQTIMKKRIKEGREIKIIKYEALDSNWACAVFDDLIITNAAGKRKWQIFRLK